MGFNSGFKGLKPNMYQPFSAAFAKLRKCTISFVVPFFDIFLIEDIQLCLNPKSESKFLKLPWKYNSV